MQYLEALEQLAALATSVGTASIARDANSLSERVREGRFYLACLGQFKRGKSTLLNALIGEELLPTGVPPVTSVVTVVRFGTRRARIRFADGVWLDAAIDRIQEYVTEHANPQNAKGVTGVEIFCPSPLLAKGLSLVDTPGIGSVFAANTEETRSFVPHIDAALAVLGGDPPISGAELELIEEVSKQVRHVIFVLNKADRLSDDERRESRAFTETILSQHGAVVQGSLFEVSALERLRGHGPERDWPALVRQIQLLADSAGAELVELAAKRGFASLKGRLEAFLLEERDALLRPIEASEQRLRELRRCAKEAKQASLELGYLFNAEQRKLAQRWDCARSQFVDEAFASITRDLDERLAQAKARCGPKLRALMFDAAQELTEVAVRGWLTEQRPIVEREFSSVTERFVEHASSFLERLRAAGDFAPGLLPPALSAETGLTARSRFFYRSLMQLTVPSLWTWLVDCFRNAELARKAARLAGREYTEQLLEKNANRVLGDFDERVVESRRSVESALQRTLEEVVSTAEKAAERARAVQAQGKNAVQAAIDDINGRICALQSLDVLELSSLIGKS